MYPELKRQVIEILDNTNKFNIALMKTNILYLEHIRETFYPDFEEVATSIESYKRGRNGICGLPSSGTAGCIYYRERKIIINEVYISENSLDLLTGTLPHELSHLIVNDYYQSATQAHGKEFRRVMYSVFGIEKATTYHSYESVNTILQRGDRVPYKCTKCKIPFAITPQLHKKIQAGSIRVCSACKTPITPIDISSLL